LVDAQERLLRAVARVLRVAQDAEADVIDVVLVLEEDAIERLDVSSDEGMDQPHVAVCRPGHRAPSSMASLRPTVPTLEHRPPSPTRSAAPRREVPDNSGALA